MVEEIARTRVHVVDALVGLFAIAVAGDTRMDLN